MELIWKDPAPKDAKRYDNSKSPYAHYWLEEHACGDGDTCVQVAAAPPMDVADLVDRAFKR